MNIIIYYDFYLIITKLKSYVDILKLKQSFGTRQLDGVFYGKQDGILFDEFIYKYAQPRASSLWREIQRAFSENKHLNR